MKKNKARRSLLELASRPVAASDLAQQAMDGALVELSRETLADVQGGLLLLPPSFPGLLPVFPGLPGLPLFPPLFPPRIGRPLPGFPPLL